MSKDGLGGYSMIVSVPVVLRIELPDELTEEEVINSGRVEIHRILMGLGGLDWDIQSSVACERLFY